MSTYMASVAHVWLEPKTLLTPHSKFNGPPNKTTKWKGRHHRNRFSFVRTSFTVPLLGLFKHFLLSSLCCSCSCINPMVLAVSTLFENFTLGDLDHRWQAVQKAVEQVGMLLGCDFPVEAALSLLPCVILRQQQRMLHCTFKNCKGVGLQYCSCLSLYTCWTYSFSWLNNKFP